MGPANFNQPGKGVFVRARRGLSSQYSNEGNKGEVIKGGDFS